MGILGNRERQPPPPPPCDSNALISGTANLVSWWDFDDNGTITLVGSDISAVTDKSSGSNDLSQGTSSLRPVLQLTPAELGGRPGAFFGGNSDNNFLQMALRPVGSGGKTTIFAARMISGETEKGIINYSASTTNSQAYALLPQDDGEIAIGRNGGRITFGGSGEGIVDEFAVIALGTDDSTASGFKNGVAITNPAAATFNTTGGAGWIGRNRSNNPQYYHGWVSEVATFSRLLTDQEMIDRTSCMASKWGII